MDKHTPEQRHKNMQVVKCKGSETKGVFCKELWCRGVYYRKNVRSILGKPDMDFKKKKVAIFCDSEFWHGYDWNNRKHATQTRRDFEIPKIERNIARDVEVNEALKAVGLSVICFWDKEIKTNIRACADIIVNALKGRE